MGNALYDDGRKGFLAGEIDWDADTIKAALVKTAYTPDLAAHDMWDDVEAHVVGTPQQLTTCTTTDGIADADDVTFTAVTGDEVSYIVIYKEGVSSDVSPLIACIDSGTGLPVTPNGGDIEIQWDSGDNKIFKL